MNGPQTSQRDECGFCINGPVIGGGYAELHQAGQPAVAEPDSSPPEQVSEQTARRPSKPEKSGGHQ